MRLVMEAVPRFRCPEISDGAFLAAGDEGSAEATEP